MLGACKRARCWAVALRLWEANCGKNSHPWAALGVFVCLAALSSEIPTAKREAAIEYGRHWAFAVAPCNVIVHVLRRWGMSRWLRLYDDGFRREAIVVRKLAGRGGNVGTCRADLCRLIVIVSVYTALRSCEATPAPDLFTFNTAIALCSVAPPELAAEPWPESGEQRSVVASARVISHFYLPSPACK